MFCLCKYKDALGEPGKGIHSFRIGGIAVADVVMTIIGALLISFIFNVSFVYTLIFLFLLGIILHHIFCVRTTVDKWLFPKY
jgi:hypothetical protein